MVCDKAKNAAESPKKRSPAVIHEDSKSVTRRMSFTYRLYKPVYPEIALFDTNEERRVAMRRTRPANMKLHGPGAGRVWIFFLIVVLIPLAYLFGVHDQLVAPHPVVGKIAWLLVFMLALATGMWVLRPLVRRSLREQLVAKGVPICVACGYDLRGQIEPRCPECGSAFDEKVSNHSEGESEEPRPRA
jgi:hypothetical protein